MQFLADESCDVAVVHALRAVGHDVSAMVEIKPGAQDEAVLAIARSEKRVLLTEDKDFIRFPATARTMLGQTIVDIVARLGDRFVGRFVVLEPGRVRISRPPDVS